MSTSTLSARVHTLRYEAPDTVSVELKPAEDGVQFPPHEPGSHIDLHLSNGLVRHYSVLNPCSDSSRYVVGVLKDRKSRGGSKFVHENLRVGQVLKISEPRNNFALDEAALHSVFLAGGIGITPMLCMLDRLLELGRTADLIYCSRSRQDTAFLQQLVTMTARGLNITYHFDNEEGRPPDLKTLLSAHSPAAHFYACGPAPMLDAFQRECSNLNLHQVHLERFAAPQAPQPAASDFTVELRRSAKVIQVSAGQSILDAMLDNGLLPDHSCREGLCGACETKVLDGQVDHRDSILTAEERRANKSMMICVSRCSSQCLVLDA